MYKVSAVNDTIFDIDIVSLNDFDKIHKAGNSVSDIVSFYGSSPYDYVKNGYQSVMSKVNPPEVEQYGLSIIWQTISCKITNITDNKLNFLDDNFYIVFDEKPEKNGLYTFEISIKYTHKTLKNTVTMEF
ncbi:MAG: hypothetical protein IKQ46_17360 [Bacteroidales bacterium]|nr:hypothetical protein [Bacteroidales bacterium]